MSIDLGDSPQGTPPDETQKSQIRTVLGVLPVAGGTMEDNATIGWHNGSAIREAGEQGLEVECSVGYRWQWIAGRMIMRLVNSGQIARIIAIDNTSPAAWDDETQGFYGGSRWETADGVVHVCADATTNAAVWITNSVQSQLDNAIGTAWRVNVPLIIGAGIPQEAFIPNYYGPITVHINYAGSSISLNLLYAGEYGGFPSYNLDGSPLPADPSLEVDYTALYFNFSTGGFYLRWNYAVGSNVEFINSSGTTDISYALDNAIDWSSFSSDYIEYFTIDGQYGVQAEINGQFYMNGNTNGNLYFSDIVEGVTSWYQFVAKDGDVGQPIIHLGSAATGSLPSAALTTVPYDKGGTNAITQQSAVNSVGGFISDVTSSRSIAATDKNTIISCTGTVVLTLPQGLDTKFNCRVLRYGTGEVTIAGAVGVTIQSHNSHKRISAQYDMITITRVANNTYVLSGNLKA